MPRRSRQARREGGAGLTGAPEQVSDAASLQTFSLAPITVDHPAEMVTAENVKALAVGEVSTAAKWDGEWVAGGDRLRSHGGRPDIGLPLANARAEGQTSGNGTEKPAFEFGVERKKSGKRTRTIFHMLP